MAAAPPHHFPLWATVATGLEEDALAELLDVVRPSQKPLVLSGQILFTVESARPEDEVAAALKKLAIADYVYARIADCHLTDAPRGDGDRGLESIRAAAAAAKDAWMRAMPLWQAMNASRPAAPYVVRAVGKRGGRHSFSSDDAKRAALAGLKSADPALTGSTSSYDAVVLAQVHDNRSRGRVEERVAATPRRHRTRVVT